MPLGGSELQLKIFWMLHETVNYEKSPMTLTKNELLRRYPHASAGFIKANCVPDCAVPHTKPQCHKTPALVSPVPGEAKSISRPRVCFTLHRVKLLDPDNAAGSVKDLLDGLRHAALIRGDEWHAIKLEVEQEKVDHYSQEKTVITIS